MPTVTSSSDVEPAKRRRYVKKYKKPQPKWLNKTILGFLGFLVVLLVGSILVVAVHQTTSSLDTSVSSR